MSTTKKYCSKSINCIINHFYVKISLVDKNTFSAPRFGSSFFTSRKRHNTQKTSACLPNVLLIEPPKLQPLFVGDKCKLLPSLLTYAVHTTQKKNTQRQPSRVHQQENSHMCIFRAMEFTVFAWIYISEKRERQKRERESLFFLTSIFQGSWESCLSRSNKCTRNGLDFKKTIKFKMKFS